MENIVNKEKNRWLRPWNITKFDDLRNHDERFFSIVIKGLLGWLNDNIVLYDKPIKHFIFQTGSSYLYIESNGYEYSLSETSGEDWIYMEMPRCLLEIGTFSIPTEELTNPYSRGTYERRDGENICGFNAEIRRLPIEITFKAKYVLSNFNESIILLQELFDEIMFQQYFNVIYLGQLVPCSIEISGDTNIEFNKPDMTGTDTNQKSIELDIKLSTNYPMVNTRTECRNGNIIGQFIHKLYYDEHEDPLVNKVYGMSINSSIKPNISTSPVSVNSSVPLDFSFSVSSKLEGVYDYKIYCDDSILLLESEKSSDFSEMHNISIDFSKFPTYFIKGETYKITILVEQNKISDRLDFYIKIF